VITLVVAALALMFPSFPSRPGPALVECDRYSPKRDSPGFSRARLPFPTSPWTEAMTWQAEEEMRFRLIGGYITTQSTPVNGESYLRS